MALIDDVIEKTKGYYVEKVDNDPSRIIKVINKEFDEIKENQYIKVLDDYETTDGGYYVNKVKDNYYIAKVINSQIYPKRAEKNDIVEILSLSYILRWIYFVDYPDQSVIMDFTKKINNVVHKYFT